MSSGLVHEIDAMVTVKGRQKRVTFAHKLFMDYLAACYICRPTQNINKSLKQAFPTWDDVAKYQEIVRACCGLMKGREEVIMQILNVLKTELKQDSYTYYHTMSSLQNECGLQTTYFVRYPSCGYPLSQILNTAKLVVIEDLTGEEDDDALPCNADIVINVGGLCEEKVTSPENSRVMRTLQRHRDNVISIHLRSGSHDVMEQMSSLLASSVESLIISYCYLAPEVVNSLSQMSKLAYLEIYASQPRFVQNTLALHGDLLVAAINAWKGHSRLQVLYLRDNHLPVSVCRPLLVAIAVNCPCLQELDMKCNTLSGCLAGFLQNPPSALRKLGLHMTDLHTDDMESLAAAFKARKLLHLEALDIMGNSLSGGAMIVLLTGMTAAVTAGKLQNLKVLHLTKTKLSEAALTPLLHALLNAMGDRKLKLCLGFWYQ